MATSSILGGTPAPEQSKGRGTDALGPSDSSDSRSDMPNTARQQQARGCLGNKREIHERCHQSCRVG